MWRNNVFLFKFDISQRYHHIEINYTYQKYLSFSWKVDGKISYFMFVVLPLSLSSGPFILPRLCAVLQNFWRKEGIKYWRIY